MYWRFASLGAEAWLGIETVGLGIQDSSEGGMDFANSDLIGTAQGIARDSSQKINMIEVLLISPEAGKEVLHLEDLKFIPHTVFIFRYIINYLSIKDFSNSTLGQY